MNCDSTDFMYPLLADLYYPIVTQSTYGQAKKEWVLDRTIAVNAEPLTRKSIQDVQPAVFLQHEGKLSARTRRDPRVSSHEENNAITNILITNIRFPNGELVYKETAGPRNGKGTIYEIATLEPFIGGLQTTEFYQMLWRKSENQSVGD
jgi:hypothetical protein